MRVEIGVNGFGDTVVLISGHAPVEDVGEIDAVWSRAGAACGAVEGAMPDGDIASTQAPHRMAGDEPGDRRRGRHEAAGACVVFERKRTVGGGKPDSGGWLQHRKTDTRVIIAHLARELTAGGRRADPHVDEAFGGKNVAAQEIEVRALGGGLDHRRKHRIAEVRVVEDASRSPYM
jgi:hypothetical protein